MDIISKRSGPRREDAQARSLIEKNRGTIEKLADQISNGQYSASRRAKPRAEPEPSGLIISDLKPPRQNDQPRPYVRVSPNHRVVVVDEETSRQMHYLGEVRRLNGIWKFVLATQANGFFSPLDPDIAERLSSLDGVTMGGSRTDDVLASDISALLGYNPRNE